MKEIHLVCNAHLDPVWLWQWREGAAEVLSTFRVAADFCEKENGFVFNHNEALLYEWIEEYDPELFQRIQRLVQQQKWNIMGGWYLQPDCLMPDGESIFRQIETGRSYFKEKFGVEPTVAVNVDSFGHSRGLVQILKLSGYKAYLFMRPDSLECGDYIWMGFDGTKIKAHKIYKGYNTLKGQTANKIREYCLAYPKREKNLIMWGIGNHGGGPSKIDLNEVNRISEEFQREGWKIIHSTPEQYFYGNYEADSVRNTSFTHCMVGCYTSMHRIKLLHRKLENELYRAEKIITHALASNLITYPEKELLEIQKTLLFAEFHDILPGSMALSSEQEELMHLGGAIYSANKLMMRAFLALTSGFAGGNHQHIPIFVYNPYPYKITTNLELEFMLEDQNWDETMETIARVYNEEGRMVPTQNEKTECSIPLDWRKKIVFEADLEACSMNRFECRLSMDVKKDIERSKDGYIFENAERRIEISRHTGLITGFFVKGKEYASEPLGRILVKKDNEDPWGMTVDTFNELEGIFHLLSTKEVNEFRGFESESMNNVQIIEQGDVRTIVEAVFGWKNSKAVLEYIIPNFGVGIELKIRLLMNDVHKMIKLEIPVSFSKPQFFVEGMFGIESLSSDGKEAVMQKWCCGTEGDMSLAILNDSIYGVSCNQKSLELSLVRTAAYAAHPIEKRQIIPHNRFEPHIDLGENIFSFRIVPGLIFDQIPVEAQKFNQKPVVLSYFASGKGKKTGVFMRADVPELLCSSMRYRNNGYEVRCVNESNNYVCSNLEFPLLNKRIRKEFRPFEIKTIRIEI